MGQKFLKIEDKIQDRESENFIIFVIFPSPTFMALFLIMMWEVMYAPDNL